MSSSKKVNGEKRKTVTYEKYGYFFIAPFFIVYLIFQLYPLINTFYWSLFDYSKRNLKVTITFAGIKNFLNVLGLSDGEVGRFLPYLGNTLIMWLGGFIPQIILSLLLAAWLTNERVKVRGKGAIKVLVYMPNIITAASISVLFAALFAQYGPITMLLKKWGVLAADYNFMNSKVGTRGLISFILFWMWYGNTTLTLIAGMLGINPDLYEAAEIDGATNRQSFFKITIPLLKPILMYTLITSAIGGLQMYDIPALFNTTGGGTGTGGPDHKSMTLAMYVLQLYNNGNIGKASAVCVLLFIVTLLVSVVFFVTMGDNDKPKKKKVRG